MNRLQPQKTNGAAAAREAAERVFTDKTLTGRVAMDGAKFQNCRFKDATLVYAGLAGTEINGCTFDATQVEFVGPASNTLALLRAMASPRSGLSAIVRASFPQVFGH